MPGSTPESKTTKNKPRGAFLWASPLGWYLGDPGREAI